MYVKAGAHAESRTGEEYGLGVLVQHTSHNFPTDEQETCLAFLDSEPLMEIDTCHKQWHRRLEAEGAKPYAIDISTEGYGESRAYLVPKSWVKLPGPGRTSRK